MLGKIGPISQIGPISGLIDNLSIFGHNLERAVGRTLETESLSQVPTNRISGSDGPPAHRQDSVNGLNPEGLLRYCSLQRPLDSTTQIRVALEAEAVLGLITLCRQHSLDLVTSEVLDFEIGRNPHPERRVHAEALLSLASFSVSVGEYEAAMAVAFVSRGLMPLDALHLAAAIGAGADYFCTTDDRLLKRGRELAAEFSVRVRSPIELVEELQL